MFLKLLNIKKVFFIDCYQIFEFINQVFYYFRLKIKINIFFKKDIKMITIVKLKKYITYIYIISIIRDKFYYY